MRISHQGLDDPVLEVESGRATAVDKEVHCPDPRESSQHTVPSCSLRVCLSYRELLPLKSQASQVSHVFRLGQKLRLVILALQKTILMGNIPSRVVS